METMPVKGKLKTEDTQKQWHYEGSLTLLCGGGGNCHLNVGQFLKT